MSKSILTLLFCLCVAWGKCGSARTFTNDSVAWGDLGNFDTATQVSCVCWIQYDTDSGTFPFSKYRGGGTNGGWFVHRNASTDAIRIDVHDSADTDGGTFATANSSLPVSTLKHYAFTLDAGSATGLNQYVNGVLDANSPHDLSTIGALDAATLQFYVGGRSDAGPNWNGTLSHVKCWVGKILTAGEVQELMYNPNAVTGAEIYAPLMGDDPEKDLSGNGHSGTVTGTVVSSDGPPVHFF